jgi:hypothetical protein
VVSPKFPSSLPANRIPPLSSSGANRDPVLIQIETHLRQAIRDAVNQGSRKPFFWGGLHGYEQLRLIAEGLEQVQEGIPESVYLRLLRSRVERVLALNRTVAADLQQAHQLLQRIARGFHYPPLPPGGSALPGREKLSSQQIAQEIDTLIQTTYPNGKIQQAQIRLLSAFKRRWKLYGPELLYCYDIPGLPQDNLQLESLFGRLRRHQRRISGRKSTRELLDFGQAQVLFTATNAQELLRQIQCVPRETYQVHRNRLAAAEVPRQFRSRLNRDPRKTIRAMMAAYVSRSQALLKGEAPVSFKQEFNTV